ncbi:MAG: mannose-6-phosphate isomerase [Bacteroidetes bacterium]|nr:mannose-6-phosphate isomerase [Bacteroidota bacterium]MDA1120208.1 mannose-6-phosphate isomerase [Bacteroidota bacterium]
MSKPALYPLTFNPIYKDKIWGGQKIRNKLGKDFGELSNCGESWEISGVETDPSIVKDGPLSGMSIQEISDQYKSELVGRKVYERFGNKFPLLIKFIDANDDLSIQVHPDDKLAMERHNSVGKTEMWYIFQADAGSKLITGFNQKINREVFLDKAKNGETLSVLNQENVHEDDVFFLPAGRIHTIGKGLLLAEIQQASDITYRIHDFDRVDNKGNKRDLHLEQSIDAIDFNFYDEYKTVYPRNKNEVINLVQCKYFTTNKLYFDKPITRNYSTIDSFVILICMEGKGSLSFSEGQIQFKIGDTILLPAIFNEVELRPSDDFKMLECYIQGDE